MRKNAYSGYDLPAEIPPVPKWKNYQDYAQHTAPGVLAEWRERLQEEVDDGYEVTEDIYDLLDFIKSEYRADNPQGAYEALENEVVRLFKQGKTGSMKKEAQEAIQAAEQFQLHANAARVRKAALSAVAEYEAKRMPHYDSPFTEGHTYTSQHVPEDVDIDVARLLQNVYEFIAQPRKMEAGPGGSTTLTYKTQNYDRIVSSLRAGIAKLKRETGKTAAPADDDSDQGETEPPEPVSESALAAPAPPEPTEVRRDEPAVEPVSAHPAEPPIPAEPSTEIEDEPIDYVAAAREEVEAKIDDPGTVEAVMEFLKEESYLDSAFEVEEGVWGWSEARNFATVSIGSHEYMVAPSLEAAEEFAKAIVRQELDDEPELFVPSFIESYINTERLASDLKDGVEEMIRESPDSYGWEPKEIVRYNEEGEEDDDGEYDEDGDLIGDEDEEAEPSDDWVSDKADEILKDPVEYLRDIYGPDTMKEAIRIAGIDIDEAAEDAVAADGAGHFLSSYDGDIHDLPESGGVYWRHN